MSSENSEDFNGEKQHTEVLRSPEQQPTLEELQEHIRLVHITPAVPHDDVLRAAAHDYTRNRQWQDERPPSFRPTLHTSLGEVFSSGDQPLGFSRDERPSAVVLPLGAVESQLLSVFPNDTILLGDVELDEEAVLVLPKGERYTGKARVVHYDPAEKTVREAVGEVIETSDGWAMHTGMFLDGPHSFASETTYEGEAINGKKFFGALLEEHPHLSYGTHFHSETGDAWRTGLVDYLIGDIVERYSDTMVNQIATDELIFKREVIRHNVMAFSSAIEEADYPQSVTETIRQAKTELGTWLNLVNADLYAREQFGKTITNIPPEVWQELKGARRSPEELRRLIEEHQDELSDDYRMRPAFLGVGQQLASMAPEEYAGLMDNASHLVGEASEKITAEYVLTRWMLIGTDRAHAEGLDQVLAASTKNDSSVAEQAGWVLRPYLDPRCPRKDTAETIAALPSLASVLQ